MFEKASRLKLRFETNKGSISVEELWEMPLKGKSGFSLDDVAKSLNKRIQDTQQESFVDQKNEGNKILELMFEIVKHIIKVKLSEQRDRELEHLKKSKIQELDLLIEEKQKEGLREKSIEELEEIKRNL